MRKPQHGFNSGCLDLAVRLCRKCLSCAIVSEVMLRVNGIMQVGKCLIYTGVGFLDEASEVSPSVLDSLPVEKQKHSCCLCIDALAAQRAGRPFPWCMSASAGQLLQPE